MMLNNYPISSLSPKAIFFVFVDELIKVTWRVDSCKNDCTAVGSGQETEMWVLSRFQQCLCDHVCICTWEVGLEF